MAAALMVFPAFPALPVRTGGGVVAYELATGELHVFAAKSVVLATGGCGRMFKTTSNAHSATGDAMAVALTTRIALAGHGVLPVPPDRAAPARDPASGDGAG